VYKGFVLLLFSLLLLTLVGCGSSDRDIAIDQTLRTIGEVTDLFHDLNKDLTSAMNRRKKDDPPELTDKDWKPLIIKAEELKKIAEKAQRLKGYTDSLATKTSPEQKKQLVESYGKQFRDRFADLDKEDRELDAAINEAEKMTAAKDKEFVKSFRKQLKDGKDVFELLTKQR
jgi:hypothetical protein